MKTMLVVATALSVVPLVLSLLMPNWYLGDKQNAVDAADLKGERAFPVSQSQAEAHEEKSNPV